MRVRGASVLATGGLILLLLLPGTVTGQTQIQNQPVFCDGTGLAISPNLWGVSGAMLQSRVELGAGGPNLMINGTSLPGSVLQPPSIDHPFNIHRTPMLNRRLLLHDRRHQR